VVIRRLQLDVLPFSFLSTFPDAAFVFIRAAQCMRTKHINNNRITANAHSHHSARFLQNTGCLYDHCSATYRLAAAKHESNAGGTASPESGNRCCLLEVIPALARDSAEGLGSQCKIESGAGRCIEATTDLDGGWRAARI